MASQQTDQQIDEQESSNNAADNQQEHPPPLPQPTRSQVLACQFSSWYTTFRAMDSTTIPNNTTAKKIRKNVTIESKIIRPLPTEFIEYLLSDGVRLPECANRVSSCMNDGSGGGGGGDDDDDGWDSSSDDNNDDGDGSIDEIKKYNFPLLTNQIQSALTALGGNRNLGCMPKLNWSSPKDATWINCGSMKCTKVGDVYLLLKSSDFVGFDLEKVWEDLAEEEDDCDGGADGGGGASNGGECDGGAVEGVDGFAINDTPQDMPITSKDSKTNNDATSNGVDENPLSTTNNIDSSAENTPLGFEYELVLRRWCNLHPSMEFRCFVYNHELVAISQRHPTKFYPHLQPPPPSDESNSNPTSIHPSTTILHAFFQTYIQHRFANGKIHKYVVDLYLDSQERVWVVDFNVWGSRTDGLLFDWDELMELGAQFGSATDVTTTLPQTHDDDDDDDDAHDDEEDGLDSIPMPEMRVVTKDMKSMTYDPLSSYRGPTDVMDLVNGGTAGNNGGGGGDGGVTSFEDFMRQCVRPSEM